MRISDSGIMGSTYAEWLSAFPEHDCRYGGERCSQFWLPDLYIHQNLLLVDAKWQQSYHCGTRPHLLRSVGSQCGCVVAAVYDYQITNSEDPCLQQACLCELVRNEHMSLASTHALPYASAAVASTSSCLKKMGCGRSSTFVQAVLSTACCDTGCMSAFKRDLACPERMKFDL